MTGAGVVVLVVLLVIGAAAVLAVIVGVAFLVSFPLAALGASYPAVLLWHGHRDALQRHAWREAADALGVEASGTSLQGVVDGMQVSASSYHLYRSRRRREGRYARSKIRVEGVPVDLCLEPDGPMQHRMHGPDLEVGDAPFDHRFRLEHGAHVAYLDAAAREGLRELDGDVTIRAGALSIRLGGALTDPEDICTRVRAAVAAAARLVRDEPLEKRLADGARSDPLPRVRARMLEELLRLCPDRHEDAQLALRDPAPDVQAVAQRHLLQAAARDDAADLAPILAAALQVEDAPLLWREALILAVERRPPGTLEALIAHAETLQPQHWRTGSRRQRYCEAVTRLADAFGQISDPRSQEAMLTFLTAADEGVRVAVARTLGQVGDVAAVPLLQEAMERSLPLSATQEAMRDAVRAIQSRVEGERGGLAVAPESGGLSEAPVDGGRLSESEG